MPERFYTTQGGIPIPDAFKEAIVVNEPQLTNAQGDGWYTVVYPSHAEQSFTASDDDEAIASAENLAHQAGETVTLYRALRMRKLAKVCNVLPDRGF